MARRNSGEIRHFRRAETTSFHRQNRCAPEIRKISKTIPRLKVQKVSKICYAAAGISRYRLTNVAPNGMSRNSDWVGMNDNGRSRRVSLRVVLRRRTSGEAGGERECRASSYGATSPLPGPTSSACTFYSSLTASLHSDISSAGKTSSLRST